MTDQNERPADASFAISEAARRLTIDITLVIEFLTTAQRAILRGHGAHSAEVVEPMGWARATLGAVAKRTKRDDKEKMS